MFAKSGEAKQFDLTKPFGCGKRIYANMGVNSFCMDFYNPSQALSRQNFGLDVLNLKMSYGPIFFVF